MTIIVISLPDSPRRPVIECQLKERSVVDFQFYDAFDARDLPLEQLETLFDVTKFTQIYQRKPAKGEIGCMLSHIGVWQQIASSDCEHWIVLEDDAIITKRFANLFAQESFPEGLTLLGHSKASWLRSKLAAIKYPFINSYRYAGAKVGLIKTISFRGTVGYILTKSVAVDILNSFNGLPYRLADDFDAIKQFIPVRTFRPFFVYENSNQLSSIEQDRAIKSKEALLMSKQ